MKQLRIVLLWLVCAPYISFGQGNSTNSATGVVKNENGELLAGASVFLQKTTDAGTNRLGLTATTNQSGIFQFTNIPLGADYRFIVSYVGYQSDTLEGYEVKENSRISISVELRPAGSALDKVVVIGYGSMRKKDLSAAVATVPDLEQAKSRPVLSVENIMQGKVAGITVVNDGGHPDHGAQVVIRGVGNRNGESPLYVVDGVPNAPYNPADVESITILKDAASAAIYGAFSGAAGVILITTRQARSGAPAVEYAGFVGAKNAWRLPQSLTADKEAWVANQAAANAGSQPLDGWDAAKNPYAQETRTDWIGSIFRTGLIQRHTVTVNAGSEKFSTLFQGRYEENQGTLVNTYAKNMSLRFNAAYQLASNIKFRQELFYNNSDSRGTGTFSGYDGTILSAIYMPRSATVYYPDGSFGGVGPRESDYLGIHGDVVNPVATLLRNKPDSKGLDIQSVSELTVNNLVTRGLSFITRFSYRQGQTFYKNFVPRRTEPGKPNNSNQLDYSTDKRNNWIWENTLNYARVFNGHSVGLMLSTTAQQNGAKGFSASAKTFDDEATWAQFLAFAENFTDIKPQDWDWKDRNQSYVGRFSYSWSDRYFMTASLRNDIAGRLPAQNRSKYFPGVTAAWKLSSESFFNVRAINLLKFRASWGRIGNINSVGLYYGYPTLTRGNSNQLGNGAPESFVYYLASLHNPDLNWETSEQKDLGIDISLLDERLNITADYFDKLTIDLITTQSNNWPVAMGFGAPLINQGRIRNTGFEFSAAWRGKIGELAYDVNGNFATLKNRVAYIDENPGSAWNDGDTWRGTIKPYRSVVGQPYRSFWLYETGGVFQTDEEAAAYVGPDGKRVQENARAGDLKFIDQNGDGKLNDDDRIYMGNAFPKITYGFTANASWKNFDFSMFWQGVGGVKLFHIFKESTLNASEQGYNRWDKILEAWSPSNTGGTIPRISANDPNNNFQTPSDWYLENGNYLRLKSVVLGYNFNKLYRNMKLRVYISSDNLLTITKYSGMDPEVGGWGFDGGQFPVSRIYAAGVKLTF
ncbi:SusC/RagA family TonB-linked outer membrane protein [Niabella aurantiaca]|uniref:SusC/RagA family TonB-linked outer membrane protein n=1 Tax=Niabella aurantiaca TaxID=379900 RepID=UPI00037CC1AD|nr:SusC/RagA family TonB-linked outer membrane protein [Niabella aurantiaca]